MSDVIIPLDKAKADVKSLQADVTSLVLELEKASKIDISFKGGDSSTISTQQKQIEALKNQIKALDDTQKQTLKTKKALKIANRNLEIAQKGLNKETIIARTKTNLLTAEVRKQTKTSLALNSAYKQLENTYAKLNQKAQQAGALHGTTSKQFKKASREALRYRAKLDGINRTLKIGRLDVGRYGIALGKTGAILRTFIGQLGLVTGVTAFALLAKSVLDVTRKLDVANKALQAVTLTQEEYIKQQDFLLSLSQNYGSSIVETTRLYTKYYASLKNTNLEGEKGIAIFDSVAKVSAKLGSTQDEVNGIMTAFTQIISKGTVQAEELRGQLGDRLPGAFNIMAKSMNVSVEVLNKMLRDGKVLADEVLPNFAKELERTFGVENDTKIKNMQTSINAFSNGWVNLIQNVESGEGRLSKTFTAIIDGATKVLNALAVVLSSQEQFRNSTNKSIGGDIYNKEIEFIKNEAENTGRAIKDVAKESTIIHKKRVKELTDEIKTYELYFGTIKDAENDLNERKAGNYAVLGKERDELKKGIEDMKKLSRQLAGVEGALKASNSFLPAEVSNIKKTDPKSKFTGKKSSSIDNQKKEALELTKFKLQQQEKELLAGFKSDKLSYDYKAELANDLALKRQEVASVDNDIRLIGVRKGSDKEKLIVEQHKADLLSIEYQFGKDKLAIVEENAKRIDNKLKAGLTNIGIGQNNELADLQERLNSQLISQKEYEKQVSELKKKHAKENAKFVLNELEKVVNNSKLLEKDKLKFLTQISNARVELSKGEGEKIVEYEKITKEQIIDLARGIQDALAELVNTAFDNRIQTLEDEKQAIENKFDAEIEANENSDQTAKKIEKDRKLLEKQKKKEQAKLDKEIRAEKKKQFEFNKAIKIADIGISTALGIMQAYAQLGPIGGSVAAALIGVIGTIQTISVLSQKFPKYKYGTKGALSKDTVAFTGDGGVHEPITMNGKLIGVSPNTDTLTMLPKGAEVHSSWDSLTSTMTSDQIKSMLAKASFDTSVRFEGVGNGQKQFSDALIVQELRMTRKAISGIGRGANAGEIQEAFSNALSDNDFIRDYLA